MPRPKGYALLLLLTIMSLAILVAMTSSLPGQAHSRGPAHPERTEAALLLAKAALIGYAAVYRDEHPGQVFGYLPLPDMGGHVDNLNHGKEGMASTSFAGNTQDRVVLGRLPWYTLHLPPLKDEYGECLWYAVSGSFKNNPQTDSMNWDTLGYLDLYSADGSLGLSGSDPHHRPVAIIFSAGPPQSPQLRTRSNAPYDNVNSCQGNYDARNYLDPFAPTPATANLVNWFAGTTDDALGPVAPGLARFLAGPLAGHEGILNDRAITITAAEIFDLVKRRNDFITGNLTDIASRCLLERNYPLPYHDAFAAGDLLHRGKLPAACRNDPGLSAAEQGFVRNWSALLFYLDCDDPDAACLQASLALPGGGTTSGPCKAALLFAGERSPAQARASAADQANPANYLEGPNLQAYRGMGLELAGNSQFVLPASGPASIDVVLCLN